MMKVDKRYLNVKLPFAEHARMRRLGNGWLRI